MTKRHFLMRCLWDFMSRFLGQYIFNERFGLETGISIKVLNYKIKSDDLPRKSKILADNYAIPFLFLYRSSLRSNPYIRFELLAGPIVDFPSYRPIMGDERNGILYLNREKVMLSIQSGVRLNFSDRRLNGLGTGLAYLYRLKPAFEFHPLGTDLFLDPKVCELKFELFYFFSLKK